MPRRLVCPIGQNNLLRTLDPADRAALEPHLSPVDLPLRSVLDEADAPIAHVVFPVRGVASMIASGPEGRRIEAGLFGREGMSGMALITGGDRLPTQTLMQIAGEGLRIEAGHLREAMAARPSMRAHLLGYAQVMFVQAMHTALANGHASLEARLARWLLMCDDRVEGGEVPLTHEFLAIMLGVRRAGVTVGTHLLEGKGLIRARRGRIAILDREGLEEEARGYYGVPEEEYARLYPDG